MINDVNKRFPVFVAHRLAKIEQASVPAQWRFIDSPSNVADHVSRSLTASELIANDSWFEGTSFVKHAQKSWSKCARVFPDLPEEFLVLPSHKTAIKVNGSESFSLRFSRYSSWYKLQTAVAWILRLKRLLCHQDGLTGALTVDELEAAQLEIVKVVRRDAFCREISLLQSATGRKKRLLGSPRKLNPMLDDGVV